MPNLKKLPQGVFAFTRMGWMNRRTDGWKTQKHNATAMAIAGKEA